jgi:hypothetical protein
MRARVETADFTKWAAVALLMLIGLIHLFEAPDQFGDARYKGILFLLDGAGCALAIVGVWRRERWGWLLGAAVAAGTAVGYVWSRSIGLPGLPVDPDLFEPLGVVSVAAEVLFTALTLLTLKSRRFRSGPEHSQRLPARTSV